VAAEHKADKDVKTTHCHILLFGTPNSVQGKNNPFRDLQKKLIPGYARSDGSWMTETTKGNILDLSGGLIYILKGGEARLVFQNNIPAGSVEAAERAWVKYEPSEKALVFNNQRKELIDNIVANVHAAAEFNPKYPENNYTIDVIIHETLDCMTDTYYDMRYGNIEGILNHVVWRVGKTEAKDCLFDRLRKNYLKPKV